MSPRQTHDRGLGGNVGRVFGIADQVGNGGEIHDPPTARAPHPRHNGLGGKHHRAQVDRLVRVPGVHRHIERIVAQVIGHVVDQNRYIAMRRGGACHGILKRRNVGHISVEEQRLHSGPGLHFGRETTCIGLVDKRHLRPLFEKPFDQRRTDAGAATGDEYGRAGKIGKRRSCHDAPPCRDVSVAPAPCEAMGACFGLCERGL